MDEKLESIRAELARLADRRKHEADLRELSRYKMPGKVVMVLEAFAWRGEELARNAFEALERRDFVTSALLTRGLMETVGGVVLLHNLVQRSIKNGLSEALDKKLDRLLLGSKNWEEMEDPIHVNNMLREVQEVIPGYFDDHYASLSEYAHPNWLGTFGAYGTTHDGEARVSFSQDGNAADRQHGTIIGRLSGSIGMCLGYCEMVETMIPDFVAAVEKFYAERDAAATSA